ncbi:hypothetical protein [uncultured Eudoraea sp.]|uniref:hypothetical protein n=1 Tax=uncultured Eudoraea sp. TaxID=1035614 RepID=UPI00261177F1|nr:hypothetical protein [uncultured Eudoraea sp.]
MPLLIYDLSQSCSVSEQVWHEKIVKRMEEAVVLARKSGKVVGTFVETRKMQKSGK